MEKPYLKVKKLREGAAVPTKREEDAGYDLYGVFEERFFVLMPGEISLIPTGLSLEFPKDWVFYVVERSGSGSKGIARRAGVVDSGYRGEVYVAVNNTTNYPIIFAANDGPELADFLEDKDMLREDVIVYPQSKGVAQGMLLYAPHVEVEEVDELSEDTQRGDGTLGSSGK